MTIQRAIEVLDEFEIAETMRGVFIISHNGGGTDIISEQELIDLAREMEEKE
jgi:hypothetical protein